MRTACFILLATFLVACSNEEANNDEPAFDMNGPYLELKVLSFSTDDNITKIELTNRLGEAIVKLNGKLRFFDDTQDVISFANGSPKDSPFSMVQNPQIVKSKSQLEITLRNSVPENATNVEVIEVVATLESGTIIEL